MKTFFKNKGTRVWFIVTCVVLIVAIVVNILASTMLFDIVCNTLGEPRVKLLGENVSEYKTEFTSKKESLENGNRVGLEICEEGFTLLKNKNGALPLSDSETKVSVFGKNSVDIAIGGSGSGGSDGSEATTIFQSLTAAGFTYNQALVDFYNNPDRSGKGRDANNSDLDSGSAVALSESFVGETPIANYSSDLWDSCANYKDVALVVLTRIGGEGADLPRTETDHIMKLRPAEKELIEKVKTLGFGKVVLVLNTASAMELKEMDEDNGIDSILWIGYAGGVGLNAFGEILKGKTAAGVEFSPSGKTVDTYAANLMHNPAWENFGATFGDEYGKPGGRLGFIGKAMYFSDYEEGIYEGYRFYETAYAESLKNNAAMGGYTFDYDEEVVYPFGYGLSYTTFGYELVNAAELQNKVLEADTSLTFKVKVTNTGSRAGREVVQLYVTPPYTPGGIEKSAKVLVGFAKTKLIPAGGDDTVEITVDSPYEFASYDYNDANKNGFKGYEVEAGAYTFAVSTDAHTSVVDVATSVSTGIRYEKDPVTGTSVVNRYTDSASGFDSDTELGSVLSRADWQNTWPARRTQDEKAVTDEVVEYIVNTKNDPNRPVTNDAMPATGKDNGIDLSELKGLDYASDKVITSDDTNNEALIGKTHTEAWDMFLDQLTVSEMSDLVNRGAFRTISVERLGVPQTIAADGPVGFRNFMGGTSIYDTCTYPCEVVIASTWNIERLYDMGVALGDEALVGDIKNGSTPYTGWYAPGLNLHRTPLGGRNFEYYSEDPFLSGKLTASILKGLSTKGVYADIKHFAVNEQETHRNGVLTWLTEQTLREVYLKGFEIAIKTAKEEGVKAMGVMSSFNRIGKRWTGGDYRLCTEILRDEWGFEGLVICDFNTCGHMMVKDMVYAGGDLNLEIAGVRTYAPNAKSATDVAVFRQASKNILYTIANSNAVRGTFRMQMPVWQIVMFVVDGVLAAGLAVWGWFAIRRAFKSDGET